MRQILSIISKEIKLLFRDPGGLITLFVLPASFIIVLSVALQGTFSSADTTQKTDIVVINEDRGALGKKLIKGINNSGYFRAIEEIDGKTVTTDDAKNLILRGRYQLAVHIPVGMTEAVNYKTNANVEVIIDPVLSQEIATIITSTIQSFVQTATIENIASITKIIFDDISKKRGDEIGSMIKEAENKKRELEQILVEIKKQDLDPQSRAITEKIALDNIKELDNRILSLKKEQKEIQDIEHKETEWELIDKSKGVTVTQLYFSASGDVVFPNSVQQNVPGWTIFALFWIVQIIALNILTERHSGAYKRILISPVNLFQYLIGKVTPFLIINLLQAVVMFLIGLFILPLLGCPQLLLKNILAMVLLTVSISFVSISFGLLFSSFTQSPTVAASLSAAVLIIMTILGGIMVPRFVMPAFMQKLTFIVPHGWALDGYLNILVKDFKTVSVLPNIAMLIGFAVVFFGLSLVFIKRYSKKD